MKSVGRRRGFVTLALMLLVAVPAMAQELIRASRSLENDALEVWNRVEARFQRAEMRGRIDEEDMRLYFHFNAFVRSASLLRELTPSSEPRDMRGGVLALVAAAIQIENLLDRSRTFASVFEPWRDVQRDVQGLARWANIPYAPLTRGPVREPEQRDRPQPGIPAGRLWWRGNVDGSDYVRLSGDRVVIQHLEAGPIRDDSFDLSSPLPRRVIALSLRKIQGRGRVELVEQPSSRNNFTAVILLEDKKGGSDTYEFEVLWETSEPARGTRRP